MCPTHNGIGSISDSFAIKLEISIRLTNKYVFTNKYIYMINYFIHCMKA